ncbi:hypothetical protein, partial [Pediococcus parvulus]|uniref:hypothetical protein n=1 Tax=Pediococcus parvulus TaxID=54062 RepID=UPI0029541B8D
DLFWRLNRSTKRTDVLFYFSDFQNRQKTGISYSPIPESVDPKIQSLSKWLNFLFTLHFNRFSNWP